MTDNNVDYDIEAILNHNKAENRYGSNKDEQIIGFVYTLLEGENSWDSEPEKYGKKKLKAFLVEYGTKPTKENIEAIRDSWDTHSGINIRKWYESSAAYQHRRRLFLLDILGYNMRKVRNSWLDMYRQERVFMCWDVEAGRPVNMPDDAPQELKDLQAELRKEG